MEKPPAAPRAADAPGQVRKPRGLRELLPESFGLGLAALLFFSIFSIMGVADYVLSGQIRQQMQTRADALARSLAIGATRDGVFQYASAKNASRVLSRSETLVSATLKDSEGKVLFRWPCGPEVAAAAIESEDGGTPDESSRAGASEVASVAAPPPQLAGAIFRGVSPGPGETGLKSSTAEVEVAYNDAGEHRMQLLQGCGLAGILIAIGYLALYHRLRRQLRPIAAVHRNLEAFATGIERRLTALSLSDTLGHAARSWNQLVEHVAQLQSQAPAQKAGEGALSPMQRLEARIFRQIIDRLPLGILRVGTNQVVSYANGTAARLLGVASDSCSNRLLAEIIPDDQVAPLLMMQSHGSSEVHFDRKRGEGDQQTTVRFATLSRAETGVGGETVVVIEDVTHLQEAEKARDNFLYHVTHELRTPLTNIQAYAETLSGPTFDDEQTRRECYNVIISETRRLSRLVEDILSISQLEVGTARIDLGDVDLVRLIRQMVQDNMGYADEKKIQLTLRLPPKAPRVRGDKQRLSVLINNLIGNAIKYTPDAGRVNVELEVSDTSVRIAVSDTGIGISDADQAHVFDKFYRAAADNVQAVSGTGLGLAIAREVARLHGGDIRLQSELGKGSTFSVELPRVGQDS